MNLVVVGLIADEDVLLDGKAGRGVQRTGRDAHRVAADGVPKQIASAGLAKSALRALGRLKPSQGFRTREGDIGSERAGHCREMAAGSAALLAMAGNNTAQRSRHCKAHATAKASAQMSFSACHRRHILAASASNPARAHLFITAEYLECF